MRGQEQGAGSGSPGTTNTSPWGGQAKPALAPRGWGRRQGSLLAAKASFTPRSAEGRVAWGAAWTSVWPVKRKEKNKRKKKAEGKAKKHGEQLLSCPPEHGVTPGEVGVRHLVPSSGQSSSSRHSLSSVPGARHSPGRWQNPGHAQHWAPAPSLSFRPAPGGESSSGGSLMARLTVHAGSSVLSALPGTVGMDAEAGELCAPAPSAVQLPPPL